MFSLQSNYAGPIDDLDPDSNVLKLNKDLSSMEEVLSQSLQPKKFKSVKTQQGLRKGFRLRSFVELNLCGAVPFYAKLFIKGTGLKLEMHISCFVIYLYMCLLCSCSLHHADIAIMVGWASESIYPPIRIHLSTYLCCLCLGTQKLCFGTAPLKVALVL